jgi:DNA-binding response OmpR family regulator
MPANILRGIITKIINTTHHNMKKIIICEDEQVLQKALSIELLGAGFEVMSAMDGEAGLALIKKDLPDLVLLDLMMPKMPGFEVLKKLKEDETTKHIPVIILSNLGQDEDRKKGLELGAADYYVKSATDLSLLTEKIKNILK